MAILQNTFIEGDISTSGSISSPNIVVGKSSTEPLLYTNWDSQLIFNKGSVLFDNDINVYKFSTLLKNKSNPAYFNQITRDNFNVGSGANNAIGTLTIQDDGKIIIGGTFTQYSGSTVNYIARINIDGTLDTTFDVGSGASNDIRTSTIQDDGKIIIGGHFTQYSGSTANRIARINTDGTLDTTFDVGNGPNGPIETTTIQPDGKILIGGDFAQYSGSSVNKIARLNTDGTLDTTFDVGNGASSIVYSSTVQDDGKIIIGGFFSQYSGSTVNKIARINTDGTLDTTFDIGSGADNSVRTLTIQPDGKILIGGDFTQYSGSNINRIARINTDGTLDTTFDIGSGPNRTVNTSTIQPDGKIIIGGQFTDYSDYITSRIARINTDGTLDNTFNIGNGANDYVYTSTIQDDGKIVIGGRFSKFGELEQNKITRLTSEGKIDKEFETLSLTPGKSYHIKITGTSPFSTSTISLVDFDIHGSALYDVEADTFSYRTPYQLIRGEEDGYSVALVGSEDGNNILGLEFDGISTPSTLGLDVEIVEVISTGAGGYYGYGTSGGSGTSG